MSNGATTQERQDAAAGTSSTTLLERVQQQLRGNPLIALLIAGAAMIAIVAALLMWARAPEYRVLYSNLTEADGGRIIGELDSRGVPYRFSSGGTALLVPGDTVHSLRLQLAEQGLPRGGNVGFELLDDQAFGVSQFAEQVNFQRGLEGELSRSIESMGPVSRARVHLAMARASVFVRDREPAKASVILTLESGRVVGEGQVNAIIHMVSSSVPELAAEDVTIVDQNGRLLSQSDSQKRGLDATQLDYIAEVERSFQQRIENILTPILGSESVRAQVAAQIDFARREETSERFGPNQPPNEAAVRSRQSSLAYNGGDGLALGIPGALSNTPPGVAASPIELPTDAEGEPIGDEEDGELTEVEESLQALNDLRQDNVINYEVDRNIQHIQHRQGQLTRLTAAVVVDYRETLDEEGEWQRVPLSDAEVAQIERLVRQAIGFSEARGDAIEIVNSPFSRTADERESLEWWQSPKVHALALAIGRYLLIALAVLLGYLLILRPLIKRYTEQPALAAAPGTGLQVRVGDDEPDPQEGELQSDDEEAGLQPYQRPTRKRRSSAYEDHLVDLREMAQEDPRMIAVIVRNWMSKE